MMPELTQIFDEQREEQQKLVQVALIQREVNTARDVAFKCFDKMISRSEDLEQVQRQSEDLLATSELFVRQSRFSCCFPTWWFSCSNEEGQGRRRRRKQK